MVDSERLKIVTSASLVVVKVGTRVLSREDGTLNLDQVKHLADQITSLRDMGKKVVLVSSGAVGAGVSELKLPARPTDLSTLQAVAAIGQTKLIEAYDRFFKVTGTPAAQILLTADDLDDRPRYLNVRNTLHAVLNMKAIPIVNENDSVTVEELQATFGDNDRLAALVTNLLRAPVMVILSDVDGLYDRDPRHPDSKLIPVVNRIDKDIMALASSHNSKISKGGMLSKLKAAKMATSAGENVIIANGHQSDVLSRIFQGEPVGTFFAAAERSISPFKRWLGFSAQTRGRLFLDDGAVDAVAKRGRSLLPIGITHFHGQFGKGDVITICNSDGNEIARGLTNYSSTELALIRGLKSVDIAEKLGYCPYDEVIHRDNLLVIDG
ncbi:MAG: glutamate 5-kinase [Planctomycetales bacterium]|nr:glutamate 5-kinase [Planctomycetales bacterium]